ncbi:MAG: hypothetical protein IJE74_04935 [Clostridia bacterium]|nr:hypothetical protein [Clostridia bacterium]
MRKTRNIFLLLLVLVICLISAGCSSANNLAIENHKWQISRIQLSESGTIAYCSSDEADLHQDAEIIDLSCAASNGEIQITDNTNNREWVLEYSEANAAPESTVYEINGNNNAVVGKTTYHDGSFEYTLIISVDDYVMYFSDKPQP